MINDTNAPNLANGEFEPESLKYQEYLELKKKHELKAQRMHDYRLTLVSAITGSVFGLLSSLIFWMLTK